MILMAFYTQIRGSGTSSEERGCGLRVAVRCKAIRKAVLDNDQEEGLGEIDEPGMS